MASDDRREDVFEEFLAARASTPRHPRTLEVWVSVYRSLHFVGLLGTQVGWLDGRPGSMLVQKAARLATAANGAVEPLSVRLCVAHLRVMMIEARVPARRAARKVGLVPRRRSGSDALRN